VGIYILYLAIIIIVNYYPHYQIIWKQQPVL